MYRPELSRLLVMHDCFVDVVFLPRLVDFDWRVDVKTSSDSLSRMSVPTCLVQLQVYLTVDSVTSLH